MPLVTLLLVLSLLCALASAFVWSRYPFLLSLAFAFFILAELAPHAR